MTDKIYDIAVIGAGPGGYIAAIRASQLGMKVVCIESRKQLGGTCLNVGCIPSKALLQSSEALHHAQTSAGDLGVVFEKVGFDLERMLKRKSKIVKELTVGIKGLFKKNKIDWVQGSASFVGPGKLQVSGDCQIEIQAKYVVIATGSSPVELPSAPFDQQSVVCSTGALDFTEVPKHLVVIGGGVIGLELGSVWLRLGAKVTVVEAMDSILFGMDKDVVKTMTKILKKQGMEFLTGAKFQSLKNTGSQLQVDCEQKGDSLEITCDKVLVSVGRKAFTSGLGLEKIGVGLDDRGRISVNDCFQTQAEGVYAIGDVIRGPMLAHKAEEEAVACVEMIAGKPGHVNYDAIPGVIYTFPEVAAIGLSEQDCKDKGVAVRIGKFPFSASARARCAGETAGFVKIIADARTDKIIGAHIVGAHASELIAELAIGAEYSASAEDIASSVHAHPTLSEAIKEACLAVDQRALNF